MATKKTKEKEKILVTVALDNRDLLKKRITKAIDSSIFVAAKQVKDEKIGSLGVEEFCKKAESDLQSINDLITRYTLIDSAIIVSNATEMIEFSNGIVISRAAAISLRKSFTNDSDINFKERLARFILAQYKKSAMIKAQFDKVAEDNRTGMYNSFIASESKENNDDMFSSIDKIVAPNMGELVDPIGAEEYANNLLNDIEVMKSEIDTLIKVSNATTYIEI